MTRSFFRVAGSGSWLRHQAAGWCPPSSLASRSNVPSFVEAASS